MLVAALVALVALLLFAALAASRPAAYHVMPELEIAAPTERVFTLLDDLHQFAGIWVLFGSPFDGPDPKLQKTFAGPGAGAGQSLSWSGKEAGVGTLTIEESQAGRSVRVKLEFVKPMASKATYTLTIASTPVGSLVSWAMDGRHNLIGKAFGLFVDMDTLLVGDLEKSLARLKAAAENKP